MPDKIKTLITMNFSDEIVKQLHEISPQLEIMYRPARAYNDIPAHVWEDAEILYTAYVLPPMDSMPKLKWVQSHFVGVDHILPHPLLSNHPDVLVTSTRGIHATNMGEYVFTMMLLLARHIPALMVAQKEHEWAENRHRKFEPIELRGATIGIVGYGAIGREVARLAKAFGMKVLASKRDVKRVEETEHFLIDGTGDVQGEYFDRLYPPQALGTMVRDCDFVVIITPLTPETRNLYSEKVIQAMKTYSFLVNVARGGVLDEKALIAALKSGHIRGAALDVFEQEPLPEDDPLWDAPNLIITPHISGNTANYSEKAAQVFMENLRRYVAGKSLMNVVSRESGY